MLWWSTVEYCNILWAGAAHESTVTIVRQRPRPVSIFLGIYAMSLGLNLPTPLLAKPNVRYGSFVAAPYKVTLDTCLGLLFHI